MISTVTTHSEDMLPLMDTLLSVQMGRTRLSQPEMLNLHSQIQFNTDRISRELAEGDGIIKELLYNQIKAGILFPIEVAQQLVEAMSLGQQFTVDGATVLRVSRRVYEGISSQDQAILRDAQAQLVESREALRRHRDQATKLQNAINLFFARVTTYIGAQRYARQLSDAERDSLGLRSAR